jgi:lipopolysaccharide/colanic/teichoic acid biosynthesis glycosyltransferase
MERVGTGYFLAKRVMDILVAGLMTLVLAPLMLIIALVIRADSPGPAIYSQKRVGCRYRYHGGKYEREVCEFTFYKFRTMFHKASDQLHREFIEAYIHNDIQRMASLQHSSINEKAQFKLMGDPRVTRVGRFLRKSSLDELPQLLNILKGEMSLVGPRPAIPYEVDLYEPWQMQRLTALPGLTGLWQVTARNSALFEDMVRMDLEYISKQSIWFDLLILIKTPLAVFDRRCN